MLFIKWMDAYLFHSLYAGYFFSSCIFVVCVFNNLFKKSSTEKHPQIVKRFGSRSVQQNVGPDLDQCKDNKQK